MNMCICDINVFKSNRMQKVQFCEKTSFRGIVVAGIVVVVVGGKWATQEKPSSRGEGADVKRRGALFNVAGGVL